MPKVTKSINVNYTPAQMCALVCDIDMYPQFIPACVASNIISRSVISDTQQQVVASLDFVKGPFKVKFTTKNIIEQQQQITMNLVSGPFQYLQGKWQFFELNNGCSVHLNLDFKKPDLVRYPILSLVEELINLGGNRVAVMSMANDYIVQKFLDQKISFNEIFSLIKEVVDEFASDDLPSLEELFILDKNIQLYLDPN